MPRPRVATPPSPKKRGFSGTPLCWFRDFIRAHNLPDISIHSLRHTNATLMINSGIPLTTIAARLDHADPTTTSKIYVHAIQSADAAAAEQLDMIFTKRQAATG